ncbi:MAG: hypothetical protein QMC38_10835 [Sinobacterium sp.]
MRILIAILSPSVPSMMATLAAPRLLSMAHRTWTALRPATRIRMLVLFILLLASIVSATAVEPAQSPQWSTARVSTCYD